MDDQPVDMRSPAFRRQALAEIRRLLRRYLLALTVPGLILWYALGYGHGAFDAMQHKDSNDEYSSTFCPHDL